MRVIYRSASKRRLTPKSSPSLIQDVLNYLLGFFSSLGVFRSALCRFLVCGLAWVAVPVFVLPWVGPLFLSCWLWRSKAVPWLLRCLSEPDDLPETSVTLRGTNSGFQHIVLKFEGQPCLKTIRRQVEGILESRSAEPNGWKLKRKLVCHKFGCCVWRRNNFNIENHVTLCEDTILPNSQNLKYKINELCCVPVDSRHPPWHIQVVPFIQKDTRATCYALLIRVHHLISSLIQVQDFCSSNLEERHLRSVLYHALSQNQNTRDFDEANDQVDPEPEVSHQPEPENQASFLLDKTVLLSLLYLVWKAPAVLIHEAISCIHHHIKTSSFQSHRNRRALSWSEPLSRDLLNRLKAASGADSVEAVLMSCLSGALHHYKLVSGNPESARETLRSMVSRSNGYLRMPLPVGECCPKTRLRRIQNSLRKATRDIQYKSSYIISAWWSKFMPSIVGSYLANIICQRYPVLVDNLHIPASDCSITEANYWKLPAVDVGLSLTFVHHKDQVTLSAVSDFKTLQRPDLLTSCFSRAVLDLALAVDVRYERKPSPLSTPTISSSGRSF